MATPTTQDVNPEGTAAQNSLLYTGRPAVIACTSKTYANLANNQTLIVAETNGASPPVPVLKTFEIEKSASGWTPTGGAVVAIDCTAAATLAALLVIVRDFINARPNAAYVWAINGTSDGLVGTAKYAGSIWNIAPTGTTLISSSVAIAGTEPLVESVNDLPFGVFSANGGAPPDVGTPVYLYAANTFAPAQSDAVATSDVLGIYTGGDEVVADVGTRLCKFDSITAGDVGKTVYLSPSGTVCTVSSPTGLRVNRIIGKLVRYMGANYGYVKINIDKHRDATSGFTIDTKVLSADSISLEIPRIDGALVSRWSVECLLSGTMSSVRDLIAIIKINGSLNTADTHNGLSQTGTTTVGGYGSSGSNAMFSKSWAGSSMRSVLSRRPDGSWMAESKSRSPRLTTPSVVHYRILSSTLVSFLKTDVLTFEHVSGTDTQMFCVGDIWTIMVWE